MNKKIIYLAVLVSLICFAGFVSAQITNPISYSDFSSLIENIVTQVGAVLVSLGTVMIIVSAIIYLTSAGSPEKISLAKKALVYAIIGIAIGVAASTIVTVVKSIVGSTSST